MKRKIQSRGMDIYTRCPMCYRLDGDGGHLFLKCKYAKLVWRELMLEDKRECLADAESSKDVFKMIWQWDEKLQVLIVVTLWMLWSPRNETNADESTQAPKITARLILKHYVDTQQLTKSNANPNIVQSNWRRQPLEYLRRSMLMGLMSEANRIGGWGFIVRDHVG
jgi:hypothetical protein